MTRTPQALRDHPMPVKRASSSRQESGTPDSSARCLFSVALGDESRAFLLGAAGAPTKLHAGLRARHTRVATRAVAAAAHHAASRRAVVASELGQCAAGRSADRERNRCRYRTCESPHDVQYTDEGASGQGTAVTWVRDGAAPGPSLVESRNFAIRDLARDTRVGTPGCPTATQRSRCGAQRTVTCESNAHRHAYRTHIEYVGTAKNPTEVPSVCPK